MSRPRPRRRHLILVTVLLVVIATCAFALGYPTLQALSHPVTSPPTLTRPATRPAIPATQPSPPSSKKLTAKQTSDRPEQLPGDAPDHDPTVFDGGRSVTGLNPKLLSALRRAATDAADDTVRFRVNSGWRSTAEQERLFRAAVQTHGSAAEAARWVARPGTSPHETGNAVDIGPTAAATWLARDGDRYGLCQIYRNEPWHYELRPAAVEQGCPTPYADPTHDPRLGR